MHPHWVSKQRAAGSEVDHLGLRVQESLSGDAWLRQFHPFHTLRCVRSNQGVLLEAILLLGVCCGVYSSSGKK